MGWCCQEFKQQRGSEEGRLETPRKGSRREKRVKLRPMKTPDLNPEVMSHWIRYDTITWCRIEDDCCLALLDTSVTINVINANYAMMLDLPMGPLSDLREGLKGVKVYGNTFAGALGYVIVHFRFDEIKGYDEDQVCLVMEDDCEFASRVPMILGTPTTECILNVITENEITNLSVVWANVRTSTIQHAYCARVNHIRMDIATKPLDIKSFDDAVRLEDKVTIRLFETSIVKAKTDTIMTGGRLHVLVHSLDAKNNKLPKGLEVSVTYTDLKRGSKSVPIVL